MASGLFSCFLQNLWGKEKTTSQNTLVQKFRTDEPENFIILGQNIRTFMKRLKNGI